jgi:hypothetical protein
MDETIAGEVIHVVEPAEHEDYDFEPEMASLADSRYVIVCRKGGKPSWLERIAAFLRRQPIEPVTLVADSAAEEGTEITAAVEETTITGVYDVTEFR